VMPTALARITPFWDTTPGRCCGIRARGSLCTAAAPGTYRRSAGKHGRNWRLVLSAAWALSSVLRDFRDRRRGERFKGVSYPTRRGDRSIYRVSALGQFTVTVIGNADAPLPVLIKKRCPSRLGWYWLPLALTGKSSFGMPAVKRSTAPLTSTAINRPSGTVAPKRSVDAVAM
jgi:hypothetical protein